MAYKQEDVHVLVSKKYETSDGLGLGRRVVNQRRAEKLGTQGQDKKRRLEQVGFVRDYTQHAWEQNFQRLLFSATKW